MSKQEKEMLEVFNRQMDELLISSDRFKKRERSLKVGLESELAVHTRLDYSELTKKRDAVIAENPDFTDVELGASQIELRTPPIDLLSTNGIDLLEKQYKQRLADLMNSAREQGVKILRVGANPFLPTIGTPRTDRLKYRLVPNFYNQNRNVYLDTMIGLGKNKNRINIGDAAIVSLFQSFQVNLEAESFEDACDKMNRSLAIAPYLLAFSGNARYLNCEDTEMQDTRMIIWEISHNDRTFCDTRMQDLGIISWEKSFDVRSPVGNNWRNELRVGLPRRYFWDIQDYLQRAGTFPFILFNPEAALAISIGMTWLDARVKFIGTSAVVELRLLSTQPTIEEEIALMLLYIGRLHYHQMNKEVLLPIKMVRENRLSAMLYGLKRPMWFLNESGNIEKLPARLGLDLELKKAEVGLGYLGLLRCLNEEVLGKMLELGSPSDRLAKAIGSKEIITAEDMEIALLQTNMLI